MANIILRTDWRFQVLYPFWRADWGNQRGEFSVNEADFLILFGPSGCGKSTLLNILLGLEIPTKGSVNFQNRSLYALSDDERAQLRKQRLASSTSSPIGLKSLNVIENVYFPLTLRGISEAERIRKATEALLLVGMSDKAHQNPSELSSGQQQRVSMARAIISIQYWWSQTNQQVTLTQS